MLGEPFPLIRIQFEGMKRTIMTHLRTDPVMLERALDHAIELAMQEFDFNNVVKVVVHQSVTQAIRDYYEEGEGRKAVNAAVSEALGSLMTKKDETGHG